MSADLAPRLAVARLVTVTGPRGGRLEIMVLACGHLVWKRVARERSRPPGPVECVTCWLLARPELLAP